MNIKIKGLVSTTPRFVVSSEGTVIGSFMLDSPRHDSRMFSVTVSGELAEEFQQKYGKFDKLAVSGELSVIMVDSQTILTIKATKVKPIGHLCNCQDCTI